MAVARGSDRRNAPISAQMINTFGTHHETHEIHEKNAFLTASWRFSGAPFHAVAEEMRPGNLPSRKFRFLRVFRGSTERPERAKPRVRGASGSQWLAGNER